MIALGTLACMVNVSTIITATNVIATFVGLGNIVKRVSKIIRCI